MLEKHFFFKIQEEFGIVEIQMIWNFRSAEASNMIMLFQIHVNIRGATVAPAGCVLNQPPEIMLQVLWVAYKFKLEGDSVQGPWAHTRVPGFEFCSTAYHVYGLWPIPSTLSVSRFLVGRRQPYRYLPHAVIVRNERIHIGKDFQIAFH